MPWVNLSMEAPDAVVPKVPTGPSLTGTQGAGGPESNGPPFAGTFGAGGRLGGSPMLRDVQSGRTRCITGTVSRGGAERPVNETARDCGE